MRSLKPFFVAFSISMIPAFLLGYWAATPASHPKAAEPAVQVATSKVLSPNELQILKWKRDQHKAQLFSSRYRLVLLLGTYQDMQLEMSALDDPRREELQNRMQLVDWHEGAIKRLEAQIREGGGAALLEPSAPFPADSPLLKFQGGLTD